MPLHCRRNLAVGFLRRPVGRSGGAIPCGITLGLPLCRFPPAFLCSFGYETFMVGAGGIEPPTPTVSR